MDRVTAAVLNALPRAPEAGITVAETAKRADVPQWQASSAIAVLKAVHAGEVEQIAAAGKGRAKEPLYRRVA